ncbi:MAG: hypothetical protein RBS96_08820, partial [Dehalococcoidales bacterium]|nr:hypothetical protein [Dehalococcoidales bacterium]
MLNPEKKNSKIKIGGVVYNRLLAQGYVADPITHALSKVQHITPISTPIIQNKISTKHEIILPNQVFQHIVHIADIHIPLYITQDVDDMYCQIFDKVYKFISTLTNPLVVLVGDFLHVKDNFKSRTIILAKEFIENIQKICPLVITLGNHDFSKTNKEIPDNISAIKNDDVIFLKESGTYDIGNYTFCFMSEFDDMIVKAPHEKAIALYHGDWPNDNRFEKYQCSMLGHIHEYSSPGNNAWYPGSLIQQNFGESIENHGLILWTLKNDILSHTFFPIENDYIYLKWKSGDPIPNDKKIFMRCFLEDGEEPPTVKNIINTNIERIDTLKQTIYQIPPSLMNIENDIKLIKEYSQIPNEIIELHKEIYIENEDISYKPWNILYLEFQNVFIYGNNHINTIDFQNGVYNLSSPNATGKSSIVNIILYALFDQTNNELSTRRNILNDNAKKGYINLVFKHCDGLFKIEKTFNERIKEHKIVTESNINFYKILDSNDYNNVKNMNGTNKNDTISIIKSYIGMFDMFKVTNIIAPYLDGYLLNMSFADLKIFFERLTKTEFYSQQLKIINDRIKKMQVQSTFDAGKIEQMKKISNTSDNIEEEIRLLENQGKELRSYINEIEYKNKRIIDEMIQLKSKLSQVEEVLESKEELELYSNQSIQDETQLLLKLPNIKYDHMIENDENIDKLMSELSKLNDIPDYVISNTISKIQDNISELEYKYKQLQFLSVDIIENISIDNISIENAYPILTNTSIISSKYDIDENYLNKSYESLDELEQSRILKINELEQSHILKLDELDIKKQNDINEIQSKKNNSILDHNSKKDKILYEQNGYLNIELSKIEVSKIRKMNELKSNKEKSIYDLKSKNDSNIKNLKLKLIESLDILSISDSYIIPSDINSLILKWNNIKNIPEGNYEGLIPNIKCDFIPLEVSLDNIEKAVEAFEIGEISYKHARKLLNNKEIMKVF